MPIDKAALSNARNATLNAANAARDANVIPDELYGQLTDGNISLQDWVAALNVRSANYTSLIDSQIDSQVDGKPSSEAPGALAHALFVAVNDQREAQGMLSTVADTVASLLKK